MISPQSFRPISRTPPWALANPQIHFRYSSRQDDFHSTLWDSGVMGVVVFRVGIGDGQPDGTGEELLHHTLLDRAGLVEAALQRGDLGVHVGEEGGDGLLFRERREGDLNRSKPIRSSACIP